MDIKQIFINILITALVIIILIACIVLVLNQFSPFKECETHDDNYIIQLGKNYITCGELKTVNITSNYVIS